jgi:hypothetical protein
MESLNIGELSGRVFVAQRTRISQGRPNKPDEQIPTKVLKMYLGIVQGKFSKVVYPGHYRGFSNRL